MWTFRNSDQAPIVCEPSSCTFPAVAHLQEYNILLEVKDQLGEESETYSFNISDRGQRSIKQSKIQDLRFKTWSILVFGLFLNFNLNMSFNQTLFLYFGLPLVLPVLKWDKVKPGVMDVLLSWCVQGNLKSLFCQVQTSPGSITEVIYILPAANQKLDILKEDICKIHFVVYFESLKMQ